MLVVEDEAAVRRSVTRLLRARGDEVVEVASCGDARAAQGAFDLGIFDIDLPDGDGVELAREMIVGGRVRAVVFHTGARHENALSVGVVVEKGSGDLMAAIEKAAQQI